MSDIKTDEEQLEALKSWWKENGQQIVTVVLVVALGYFGWSFWQDRQTERTYTASGIYMQLAEAVDLSAEGGVAYEEELQSIRYLADQLQNEYAGTKYAVLGAMAAARVAVSAENFDEARERLDWALANADSEAEEQLIRYRLAQLVFAQGDSAEALAMLTDESADFAALYSELRGDIYLDIGDREQAVEQYRQALDTLLPGQQQYRSTLQIKLDTLTEGPGAL